MNGLTQKEENTKKVTALSEKNTTISCSSFHGITNSQGANMTTGSIKSAGSIKSSNLTRNTHVQSMPCVKEYPEISSGYPM